MKKWMALMTTCSLLISAQQSHTQTRQYTIEEATLGLKNHLAPKKLLQTAWIPGTHTFIYTDTASANAFVIGTSVPGLQKDTLIDLATINSMQTDMEALRDMPALHWITRTEAWFQQGSNIFRLMILNNRPKLDRWYTLPDKAENLYVADNGHILSYTSENNLYCVDANGKMKPVTNDREKHIINGQAVHRNEFGIDKGIFISPKGNYIAFYRMDETMVADYPVINWDTVPAQANLIKYPMAGQTSHQVRIGIYNPLTGQTVFLKVDGPKDQYLTSVTWSPDEKDIYTAILNRDQNHLQLNKYNASDGTFEKTLFEENNDKYVEPQYPLYFLPGRDQEFLWFSQRSGFMHLYRYNTEGKLLNAVTEGNWLVNDIIGFNQDRQQVIFYATRKSPLNKNIYAARWDKKNEIKHLDNADGIHTAISSTDGHFIFDSWQNNNTPRLSSVSEVNGKFRHILQAAPDPLAAYQRPRIDLITLKASDGTPLYGKIIYPIGFDSTKKYPVIDYLYNGPHVQLITNTYPASGNLWYEYLAQHGYIVFTMDGRGSSNRGLQFEQATFRHLGTIETEDQLQGVAYLKSLPYVDSTRMGLHGWSFGGFMTTTIMTRHPDIFKCAVAGGPVIDWNMYEVMYTERYMDRPQDNSEGYKEANLLNQAQNLKGHLLMIHGTDDVTVVWQQSLKFIKKCIDNGIQIDYFAYPGHPHNVQGKDRVHLMQKITDYFDQYLK